MCRSSFIDALALLLPTLLATGACSSNSTEPGTTSMAAATDICAKDTRAPKFEPQLSFSDDAGITVKLMSSEPSPPKLGDNAWTIALADASGVPIAGASLVFKQWMVDHGHPGAKNPLIKDLGGGRYSLSPVNFNMPGYWENYLSVTTDTVDTMLTIKICALE